MDRESSCIAGLWGISPDTQVELNAWLGNVRRGGSGYRFDLHDRTGLLPAAWAPLNGGQPPPPRSAIHVSGRMTTDAKGEGFLVVEDLEVINRAADDDQTPIPRCLEMRSESQFLIFAIQTTLEAALREFAVANGFIELHTPKISGGGSESGATVFDLSYFGDVAYLIQSPQFYMQMAMVAGFDRVFEIGPVFRSETGRTPIHASEFTIAHFEMSWIDSHQDLMDFEEELLRNAIGAVVDAHGEKIEEAFGMPAGFPPAPVPRFSVGAEITSEEGPVLVEDDASLAPLERALSKRARRELGHSFAFLMDYPTTVRPFYTMHFEPLGLDDPTLSRSFDLLWHGIEITSGGQREHRFDRLQEQIDDAGIPPSVCEKYIRPHFLEIFRHGAPPHGGFGIGLNRLMMALLGRSSIQETSFVFRGPRACVP
jgi:aspartyl/asparaginyl-tRNA synthetase